MSIESKPTSPVTIPSADRSSTAQVSRRVRVMLLTSSLEHGGAERQVVELANGLDERMFQVSVCSLSNDNPLADDLRDAARRFIVEPKRRKYDLGLIGRMARRMSRMKLDVVHSFMFDAEMVGRLSGRLARVPAIICSNRCPHLTRSEFKLRLARWTRGCFDLMVANSHAGMEFERDRQKVAESKLCVIPNGVDTLRFYPGRSDALHRMLGFDSNDLIVGMVAHFRSNKDHGTLIDAAVRIIDRHPKARFVLIGQPDDPDGLYKQARAKVSALGLEECVRFVGPCDNIVDCYRCMNVKVLSTRFEGTPNVVLEAMACGLPVVVSDVCDNRRIVSHHETGFLVPSGDTAALADTLCELLADESLRQEVGQRARDWVQKQYSTQALARRTGDAYFRVLRNKGIAHEFEIQLSAADAQMT